MKSSKGIPYDSETKNVNYKIISFLRIAYGAILGFALDRAFSKLDFPACEYPQVNSR
jgi:hypothetical protein